MGVIMVGHTFGRQKEIKYLSKEQNNIASKPKLNLILVFYIIIIIIMLLLNIFIAKGSIFRLLYFSYYV